MGSTNGAVLQLGDRNKTGWVDCGKDRGGVKNRGGKKVIDKPESSG